jgi:hypothetical protein
MNKKTRSGARLPGGNALAKKSGLPKVATVVAVRRRIEDAAEQQRSLSGDDREAILALRSQIEAYMRGALDWPAMRSDRFFAVLFDTVHANPAMLDERPGLRSFMHFASALMMIDQVLEQGPTNERAEVIGEILLHALALYREETQARASYKAGKIKGQQQRDSGAQTAKSVNQWTQKLAMLGARRRPKHGEIGLAEQVAAKVNISPERVRQIWKREKQKQA